MPAKPHEPAPRPAPDPRVVEPERSGRVRVVLVEDHALLRELMRNELELTDDILIVGEAGSAAEAREVICEALPDVVLQDIKLPDGDGIDVCRDVRSSHPEIRFLILSGFSSDVSVMSAIVAGASGYLCKTSRSHKVVAAIREVGAGRSLLGPGVTMRLFEHLRSDSAGGGLRSLTSQERQVLQHIRDGLTNREIAARMFLSEKTVRNYVSKVLSKLQLPHRTSAAVYAAELERDRSPEDEPRPDR